MTGPGIDVALSASEVTPERVGDRNVAVIDVLRASSVMGHALAGGARSIVPAGTVEEAFQIRDSLAAENPLLCGEREGLRVPGFDLGNSPFEYQPGVVGGRTLVFASTNGSVVLSRCGGARLAIVACFNNLTAAADLMRREGGSWLLAACGKLGVTCLEDVLCAGALTSRLEAAPDAGGDGLRLALAVHGRYGTRIDSALRSSSHGRYLISIGFAGDVELCARADLHDIVPELRDGRIRMAEENRTGP